jgi:hypothetical protein
MWAKAQGPGPIDCRSNLRQVGAIAELAAFPSRKIETSCVAEVYKSTNCTSIWSVWRRASVCSSGKKHALVSEDVGSLS